MSDIYGCLLPPEIEAIINKDRRWYSQAWEIRFSPGYYKIVEGGTPGAARTERGWLWITDEMMESLVEHLRAEREEAENAVDNQSDA